MVEPIFFLKKCSWVFVPKGPKMGPKQGFYEKLTHKIFLIFSMKLQQFQVLKLTYMKFLGKIKSWSNCKLIQLWGKKQSLLFTKILITLSHIKKLPLFEYKCFFIFLFVYFFLSKWIHISTNKITMMIKQKIKI